MMVSLGVTLVAKMAEFAFVINVHKHGSSCSNHLITACRDM